MAMLWVIFVALAGPQLGHGLPLKSTPQVYPHDVPNPGEEGWGWEGVWYAALPAVALVVAGVAFLLGCTWCYSHKDCKQPNEGAENQLFSASVAQLQQDGRRSQPPDSGFSEPANNNISEDNNNGPISLREMQNIANNNAAAYIVSENEERNRGRESVVEFEPLPAPAAIGVPDPLERCADWFGTEDFPRNRLQYLREFARGWFGRVVETEMEEDGSTSIVAVKILNQNASLEDKARFLTEARVYRDARHENVLACRGHCLHEDPWILIFDMYFMTLREYISQQRATVSADVSLRLVCDVAAALEYLHARGYYAVAGPVSSDNVLVKETEEGARAVVGSYVTPERRPECSAPESRRDPPQYTASSQVWELGSLLWEVCGGGLPPPTHLPPSHSVSTHMHHLYQVIQLCWNVDPELRPTAAQVHLLLSHLQLYYTQDSAEPAHDGSTPSDFEERWQRLKPNSIPKCDEHVALVHAPSTSNTVPHPSDTLSLDMDAAYSRSSSIMSDHLADQYKSDSLNNLHGSLDDVRNIYLTHNETPALECHQGNIAFEERDRDRSDSSMDPWLKDIVAGSQDDVSYYRDVSDVIKNLDNILNSEKTSSSESSHQASPSRDNLSLDCKKDYQVQSSMVKSPGISNFQNVLQMGFDAPQNEAPCDDDEIDRDTIGTLSHSFERHSDTMSQQTLENLTPDTPNRDIDIFGKLESHDEAVQKDLEANANHKALESPKQDMPNENKLDCSNKIPKLQELCETAASSSLSEPKHMNAIEDCERSCDSKIIETIRTDSEVVTKSVDNIANAVIEETTVMPVTEELNQKHEVVDSFNKRSVKNIPTVANVLPDLISDSLETKHLEKPPSLVNEDLVKSLNTLKDENIEPVNIYEPDVATLPALKDTYDGLVSQKIIGNENTEDVPENKDIFVDSLEAEDFNIKNKCNESDFTERSEIIQIIQSSSNLPENPLSIHNTYTPEIVQNVTEVVSDQQIRDVVAAETDVIKNNAELTTFSIPPSKEVQNINKQVITAVVNTPNKDDTSDFNNISKDERLVESEVSGIRSETNKETEQLSESTVYMDLNNTNSSKIVSKPLDDNVKKVIESCLEKSNGIGECTIVNNESTIYLDLPSIMRETENLLQAEKVNSSQGLEGYHMCTSTPKMSDSSENTTLENSVKDSEVVFETKIPSDESAGPFNRFEQKYVPDISPFESPTKSHPTDTYDENSSVVLGPFENCSIELFKGGKCELVDLPKEELLAFSSNFSEINLETPSPLRDVNFLNEVPDVQFDDITTSENKPDRDQTENTEESDQPGTAKRVSPSTPPNSPGIFLASTSQEKYLVNIDLDTPTDTVQSFGPVESYPPIDTDSGLSSLQKEIDLNQIELTTKMAMAENENNMNIEYSGPLTVEGLVTEDDIVINDSDAFPEVLLAGNGGTMVEPFEIDEDCMKALRNELELKLPLAQVATIEPPAESESDSEGSWGALPPPPELILHYAPPALSPIQEETRHQLHAYENDAWIPTTHTDSSESYLEPCNNSTDEVTELPTGLAATSLEHSTYTVHSRNGTYTIQKDIPSSNEMTMSADSLNGSPFKKPIDPLSPIDDKTYDKDDEKESNCERISQVSPFLMSPTTETSAPVDTENVDNATGVSTLSKTTLPTDAKHSKPSECLSKATSIDSWCSNDTLYNVEENFDDLIMEPEVQTDFEHDQHEKDDSESTDTLTHHEYEKDASHCSTYIIHDSKSEVCDTFSPDSINANDNNTYTKAKTVTGTTDVNDSTKNTQTKDLAYGTLPSYSNCTTELMSGIDDPWKLPQPEMVRRSPLPDEVQMTPPKFVEEKEQVSVDDPQTKDAALNKMNSVEMSCLQDDLNEDPIKKEVTDSQQSLAEVFDSPKCYTSMAPSYTSTPVLEEPEIENAEKPQTRPLELASPETDACSIPNFQSFQQSAETKPQDLSENTSSAQANSSSGLLLAENESSNKDITQHTYSELLLAENGPSNKDLMKNDLSIVVQSYSDFECSAMGKPQNRSSQNSESSLTFSNFRSLAREQPQDLSSLINASSLLLESERRCSDSVPSCSNQNSQNFGQTFNQSNGLSDQLGNQPIIIPTASIPYLGEFQPANHEGVIDICVTDYEDENEQPHSIIITEMPTDYSLSPAKTYDSHTANSNIITSVEKDDSKESPNRTFDSHLEFPPSYNSHTEMETAATKENTTETETQQINGVNEAEEVLVAEISDNSGSISVQTNENSDSLKNDSSSLIFDISGIKSTPPPVKDLPNGSASEELSTSTKNTVTEVKCNGNSENYAVLNVLNEPFEELTESNVDRESNGVKDFEERKMEKLDSSQSLKEELKSPVTENQRLPIAEEGADESQSKKVNGTIEGKIVTVTDDFLQNEKNFCQLDAYIPLLNDIRFTGPAAEIMSTSFSQESPTDPEAPECEQDSKPNTLADIMKDWDSDSDSHSSNSSSGEFIWKDGDGHETALVPNTHFDHQRGSGPVSGSGGETTGQQEAGEGAPCWGSSGSGSGSEGDEVEFVPSSWDCRAAPAKSSLRSIDHVTPDNKKRVVFKRQKYHCVYEYPREVADVEHSPAAYLPDFSTYCDWDPTSAEEAELGYGQLFGGSPLDMYPLRAGIAFGADFDEDFFISSTARPFESLGLMSSASQFFPGMAGKARPRALPDLPPHTAPSIDFTTPDSGVEDITPGSTSTDDDFKTKLPESEAWRPTESGSSSESVSPSSPGGEALGGLRHTRDKLKLDLPPSPHIPSPRHSRVFNFVLDKPKRRATDDAPETEIETGTTPLVMTDETPIVTTSLPLPKEEEVEIREPTFSTFGKEVSKLEDKDPEQKIILTDEIEEVEGEGKESGGKEGEKGEGGGDSADEDSGIESSAQPACPHSSQ